jgi:hypothetical protein
LCLFLAPSSLVSLLSPLFSRFSSLTSLLSRGEELQLLYLPFLLYLWRAHVYS